MTQIADLLPGGIALQELAANERDGLTLEKRCGSAVLVLSTVGMQKARVLQKTTTHDVVEPAAGDASAYFAVPVRKGDGSPGAVIRVGRAASNDVVINDVTLSKLHAFIRVAGGSFTLEDGGSKNGTFIDEKQVAPRGEGPPVPIKSNAALRFGSINLRFLAIADLRALMKTTLLG